LATIVDREYVEIGDKKLLPTTLGRVVTELLVEHFSNIVDYGFTSDMEQQLDDIAEGQKKWVPVLRDFYTPFERTLATAKETMRNVKREEVLSGLVCPKCQAGELAIKFGRNGEFLACNRYPECDFTSDFHRDGEGQIVLDAASAPEISDVACNVCGKPMVIKKSRFGPFLGCSGYPECKNTRRLGKDGKPVPLPQPTGVACPKCGEGQLMQRRGKFGRPFYGCDRYPKCDYLVNDLSLASQYVPDLTRSSGTADAAQTSAPRSSGKQSSATTNRGALKKPAAASTTKKPAARAASSTTTKPAGKKASTRTANGTTPKRTSAKKAPATSRTTRRNSSS
jgi:DNA topoisomerase-1